MKTFDYKKWKCPPPRKITGKSLTIPDQSMSLREILTRYANGIPAMGNPGKAEYGLTFEMLGGKKFEQLDLTEQHELAASIREVKKRFEDANRLQEIEAEKQKEAERIEAEVNKRVEAAAKKKVTENQ